MNKGNIVLSGKAFTKVSKKIRKITFTQSLQINADHTSELNFVADISKLQWKLPEIHWRRFLPRFPIGVSVLHGAVLDR